MRGSGGKQYYVCARGGKPALARGLTQHPLAPIAEHGVTQPLCGNEGHPALGGLIATKNGHPNQRMTVPSSAREDLLKLFSRLDGLHGSASSTP